jgi:hypothetical protein
MIWTDCVGLVSCEFSVCVLWFCQHSGLMKTDIMAAAAKFTFCLCFVTQVVFTVFVF